MNLLLGSLPTLSSLTNYVSKEGGNAITIILIFFAIVFLFKQQIGKMISFFILAGLVFFTVGNPTVLINAFEAIAKLVIN